MTTYETICDIIKDKLCLEDDFSFSEEMTFNDLQADSLDLVEIIMALEDSYDIEISDDDLDHIKTLGELTDLINKTIS